MKKEKNYNCLKFYAKNALPIDLFDNTSLIKCSLLEYIPDISKWNTMQLIDMKCLFFNCSSLTSLPDISNWNIDNVIDLTCVLEVVHH